MESKYQLVLAKVLERLNAEVSNLRLVLLCGSVSRGEGSITSDLDLYCIIDGDYRFRQTWVIDDILIEVFINPYQQILEYFAQEDLPSIHMMATGQVVYGDPSDPVLIKLVEIAQRQLTIGPTQPTPFTKDFSRYFAMDRYEDAIDVADDPENCHWVGIHLLKPALEFYFQNQGRWIAKPKNILKNLKEWNPDLEKKIREYLAMGNLVTLKEIMDQIYESEDSMARFEFGSSKDEKIPLSDVEVVLIRHGWPLQDKTVGAKEWVLDFTAYLELARYLNCSELQEISTIYTSPQIKAKQTASFYYSQLPASRELKMIDELVEVNRPEKWIDNYSKEVEKYLAGETMEDGWEKMVRAEERIIAAICQIGKEARKARNKRVAVVAHGLIFTLLKKRICNHSKEDVYAQWGKIPFGPWAVIKVNAFDEIEWINDILTPEE